MDFTELTIFILLLCWIVNWEHMMCDNDVTILFVYQVRSVCILWCVTIM